MSRPRKALAELQWPTDDVRPVAEVIGVSYSTLYAEIASGTAPVRSIKVRGRIKVLTASVYELLEEPRPVRSGDMASNQSSSETMPGPGTGLVVKRELSSSDARTGGGLR